MPTLLLNGSVEQSLTLPHPWQGAVPPGGTAILREEPDEVEQFFGTQLEKHPVTLQRLAAATVRESDFAPYDPVVRISSTDSPYTLRPTARIGLVDTSVAAVTVKLPRQGGPHPGWQVQLIDQERTFGSHNLTIDGNGNQINGSATLVSNQNAGNVTLSWTGSEWTIVSGAGQTTLPAAHAATHRAGGSDPLLAAPGPIGGTTPAAGTFTDVITPKITASNLYLQDSAGNREYTILPAVYAPSSGTIRTERRVRALSLAANATYDITSLPSTSILRLVQGGELAMFGLANDGSVGTGGVTYANYSTTAANPNTINVFKSGNNTRIENKRGGTITLYLVLEGANAT